MINGKTGHLYDTILVWPKTWYVETHFKLLGTAGNFFNLFHFTTGYQNRVYGSRIPGIWIKPAFFIRCIVDANGFVSDFFTNYRNTNLIVGITYHVRVEQVFDLAKSKYVIRFYVNRLLFEEKENSQASEFQNVKVYTCNPWHACDGEFAIYGFKYGPLPDASA